MKPDILGYTLAECESLAVELGDKKFRGQQLYGWMAVAFGVGLLAGGAIESGFWVFLLGVGAIFAGLWRLVRK